MHKQTAPAGKRPANRASGRAAAQLREHVARSDAGDAFLPDPRGGPAAVDDELAEQVAEDFVASATSGEEAGEDSRNAEFAEELGGPFVETRAQDEFAHDTDASNPPDAEPAPLPTANGRHED